MRKIDEVDRVILSELLNDARKPFQEIARTLGVSGAAVHQRVKRLEDEGVILGSRILVKPSALGLSVCVYINISLSEAHKYQEVVEALKKIPEIAEVHFVTGKYALLVKAYCVDNDHLINVLIRNIQNIPYIQATDTMISLYTAFERQVMG